LAPAEVIGHSDSVDERRRPAPSVDELNRRVESHRAIAAELVGLREAEARERAEKRGLKVRVIPPEIEAVTLELDANRMTLCVSDGLVRRAFIG
jgi:hypothetical protein